MDFSYQSYLHGWFLSAVNQYTENQVLTPAGCINNRKHVRGQANASSSTTTERRLVTSWQRCQSYTLCMHDSREHNRISRQYNTCLCVH